MATFSGDKMAEDPSNFFRFLGFRTFGKRWRATRSKCSCAGVLKAEDMSSCKAPNKIFLKTFSGVYGNVKQKLKTITNYPAQYVLVSAAVPQDINCLIVALHYLNCSKSAPSPHYPQGMGADFIILNITIISLIILNFKQ